MKHALVTGATGAIGPEVLKRVRERHPGAVITLLGRNPPREPPGPGVRFLQADLGLDDFGQPELRAQVAEVTHVIHMAAEIRWNQSLDASAALNVAGTVRLLDLVRESSPKLERFVFVSTAFVAPPPREPGLPPAFVSGSVQFANSYEYSKWLAEERVRESGLPWCIVRPSLVVGSSVDGSIGRFNGVYMLVEHGVIGRVPFVLGNPNAIMDCVSVDLVADAIADSLTDPELLGGVVLVCRASPDDRARAFMNLMGPYIDRFRKAAGVPPVTWPAFVSYDKFNRLFRPMMEPVMRPSQLSQLEILKLFLPYFTATAPIDVSGARRLYRGYEPELVAEKTAEYWLKIRRKKALSLQYQWRAQTLS